MEDLLVDTRTDKEKYYDINRIEVFCGWGMAEDIIIFSSIFPNTSIGMTIAQAKKLLADLADAVDQAEELEAGYILAMQAAPQDALLAHLLETDIVDNTSTDIDTVAPLLERQIG